MVAKVSLNDRGEKPIIPGSWKSRRRHEGGPCGEVWKPLPRPQPEKSRSGEVQESARTTKWRLAERSRLQLHLTMRTFWVEKLPLHLYLPNLTQGLPLTNCDPATHREGGLGRCGSPLQKDLSGTAPSWKPTTTTVPAILVNSLTQHPSYYYNSL